MRLVESLREIRVARGVLQREIAAKLGITQTAVSNIERKPLAVVGIATLTRYVRALGGTTTLKIDAGGKYEIRLGDAGLTVPGPSARLDP